MNIPKTGALIGGEIRNPDGTTILPREIRVVVMHFPAGTDEDGEAFSDTWAVALETDHGGVKTTQVVWEFLREDVAAYYASLIRPFGLSPGEHELPKLC